MPQPTEEYTDVGAYYIKNNQVVRVKEELLEKHGADLVCGPDAYLTLPDLMAQAEMGHKAINVELSLTETYRDVVPQRICGVHIGGLAQDGR